ncbi:bifunctional methylenetetrahydrofolate dehydrogenase/methenyltetrahydrofolate cyclohydrolase [Stackebrandtia nassauensis]|uniref:Bifunctional protein FolD n=1 Tax=Stackebrandtia nassauensis (strain DSM 44728 / CIP 108903 / NRRL B-16338 / NBRC 102104 / LLR-40K-21) TaxID=446470 RepID=D3QAN1_STANL|nr:bifunctional methylenetetrahydrofolate dehydrogenase/methenyltetrahydrofolate cyclohydrolase [Stackebrandtia nassauensis]ADD44677.1 Methylenetetrahydrofolate dehydrogenase (NADP(+)) [Stackebrandtia nassauensis DSM 44728]
MRDIDGRAMAKAIGAEVAATAERLRADGVVPTLAVVVPTDDESTAWYVRSIERAAQNRGVECRVLQLEDPSAERLKSELDTLSADDSVHGIICQTPLPEGVTLADVGEHIAVAKDVDGANPASLGRLAAGLDTFAPATAAAVAEILRQDEVALKGKNVTIIGRSTVVGKPAALLLLAEHATVTICHSRTENLPEVCARADVLVAAVGRPEMVTAEYVKPGAIVIDVGTNPTAEGGLVGDVNAESVASVAGALTPVPGGVGPVTTQLLLRHTVQAAA